MDYVSAVTMREQVLSENRDLYSKCREQRSTIDSLADQLERYKTIEEKLFAEKEGFKSQLEAAQEEKAKLSKVGFLLA